MLAPQGAEHPELNLIRLAAEALDDQRIFIPAEGDGIEDFLGYWHALRIPVSAPTALLSELEAHLLAKGDEGGEARSVREFRGVGPVSHLESDTHSLSLTSFELNPAKRPHLN